MICKNCGNEIAENSKFCGYCGSSVEVVPNVEETVSRVEETVPEIEPPKVEDIVNYVEPPKKDVKKNNLIPILAGIAVALLTGVLLFVAFNKAANSSVGVLEKAFNKLKENGADSGTITAKVSVQSTDLFAIDLSGVLKYQKNVDAYNFEVKVNKSLFNEEMTAYANVSEEEVNLYLKSSILKLAGIIDTDEDVWLRYNQSLEGLTVSQEENVDMNKIISAIDASHFSYINKKDNLNHYRLIIDSSLIKKIAKKLELDSNTIEEMETELQGMGKINVDIYLTDENEFAKIVIDLSKVVEDEDVTKAELVIEFSNLNSTFVSIPNEAINSVNLLDEYIEEHGSYDMEDYDLDI